jgi:arsenate reductase
MAAAFFNQFADPKKARAISAGTRPGTAVHREVITVMREVGIDLSQHAPQRLTPELASTAQFLITMGCGDECPYVPGTERDDWQLDDPKEQPMEAVRRIRDDIQRRIGAFVKSHGWQASEQP